jgi:hypothetical protein
MPGERSTVSLTLPDDLTLDGWVAVGKSLETVERSHMWWIGDWLVYGGEHYPDAYEEAARQTGLAYSTLRNAKWVAGVYGDVSLRSDKLSWHHHRAAAGIERSSLREQLLRIAEGQPLTVAALRKLVALAKEGFEPAEALERLAGTDPGDPDEDDYSDMLSDGSDPDALDVGKRFALVNGILADLSRLPSSGLR